MFSPARSTRNTCILNPCLSVYVSSIVSDDMAAAVRAALTRPVLLSVSDLTATDRSYFNIKFWKSFSVFPLATAAAPSCPLSEDEIAVAVRALTSAPAEATSTPSTATAAATDITLVSVWPLFPCALHVPSATIDERRVCCYISAASLGSGREVSAEECRWHCVLRNCARPLSFTAPPPLLQPLQQHAACQCCRCCYRILPADRLSLRLLSRRAQRSLIAGRSCMLLLAGLSTALPRRLTRFRLCGQFTCHRLIAAAFCGLYVAGAVVDRRGD